MKNKSSATDAGDTASPQLAGQGSSHMGGHGGNHTGNDAPLAAHLAELRWRLMKGFIFVLAGFGGAYAFKEQVFAALTLPLFNIYGNEKMIFTAVHELFFTYLKLSFLCGLFVGLPFLLNQIWRFIAPGLYLHERAFISLFLILTPLLFYLGGVFSYFVVMPLALEFFFSFANNAVMALPSVKEYLSFFVKLTFGFGLAFQLPVLLMVLAFAGLIDVPKLRWFRRYAWVLMVLFSAVLTPPDPLSQVLLALPMVFLYEVSILMLCVRRKNDAPV